ncbi:MAG: radical SAM protein [Bacteroidales bacterium]|nr:radical SAM protein [Bacteroidales bacterium]
MFSTIRNYYNFIRYKSIINYHNFFCQAPFSSLYVDYAGNIFVCFVNKYLLLGNIHQLQHINDIWFGKQINELRESIVLRKLNKGCHVCKHHLEKGNFAHVYAQRYNFLPIGSLSPKSLELQLSPLCNFNCLMCVVKDEKNTVNIEPFKNFIEKLAPNLINISFSGGEPFFIDEYYDMWEIIYKTNPHCKVSVNTNASIVNKSVEDILQKLKFNITVSIDGYSTDIFESIRKGGNRDIVYNNLHYFHEYTLNNNTSFGVKICALQQNIHEFPELFEYFTNKNIRITINEVVYPINVALWNMPLAKLKYILKLLQNKAPKINNHPHNYMSWHGVIKLILEYIKNKENFFKQRIRYEKNGEQIIVEKLNKLFLHSDITTQVIKKVFSYAATENERIILCNFFLLAPIERLLPELELRDETSVESIVKHILNHFYIND